MAQITYDDGDQLSVARGVVNSNSADAESRLTILEGAATQTVNFTSTDTAAEIQALIDAVPKYIPGGNTVTFQFGTGTYTLSATLTFTGFYGGGIMEIQGNTAETNATIKHTTQDVILDSDGSAVNALTMNGLNVSFVPT